ncbi:hypothetical protein GQ44DRAFT_713173, partial [Phaeosphaeriaceae sp. PMI808]
MAEAEDAPEMAQPAPNPDAQTTVNDFLDYTEFFPSDLVRSLTLIGDLDSNYCDAIQQVHELTARYCQLPSLSEQERSDPVFLRKQIALNLQKAINQREYAFTEASRLYEVTVRHCQRSSIIRRKLQAQPQPPSRDPTPPPVSPQAQRLFVRDYQRPQHLRLNPPLPSSARPRDRHRKPAASSRRPRVRSVSSTSSNGESDIRSNIDVAIPPKKLKQNRDRHGGRVRPPGVLGTNVHSSIAGISTSNALAQLAPPPPDAPPGSKWAPWMKLTEWEMAVLRKQMKKNAVWTPSLTMVNRELERKHRTREDYEREKARCEGADEEILDEEPESLQTLMAAAVAPASAVQAVQAVQAVPVAPTTDPLDTVADEPREDGGSISIRLKPIATKEGRKLDRLSQQRQQAMRDAQELENATSKIQQAADSLKEITFISHSVATPTSQRKKSVSRSLNKRKRDTTPPPATEEVVDSPREASAATQDSGINYPEAKRPRLHLQLTATTPDDATSPVPTPTSVLSTPKETLASAGPSPGTISPVHLPQPNKTVNGNTVQVPLAPAGPSTPKTAKTTLDDQSQLSTPTVLSPSESPASPDVIQADMVQNPPPPQPTPTAASSRPRRESVAPKAASPPLAPGPSLKTSKTTTPVPEPIPDAPAHATRPRSARGHVPTPKAQSEEPKPNEIDRLTRETRRHSIFSQSALTAPGSTRMSTRKKPPPKGEVTAAEDGQKTVTNVKRAQGS